MHSTKSWDWPGRLDVDCGCLHTGGADAIISDSISHYLVAICLLVTAGMILYTEDNGMCFDYSNCWDDMTLPTRTLLRVRGLSTGWWKLPETAMAIYMCASTHAHL